MGRLALALSEKSRNSIYQAFAPLAGEEAIGEMLSHFPRQDGDELITTRHLDAGLASVRTEMAHLSTDLRTEMADLHTELRTEMADLRTDLQAEMAHLRTDLQTEMAHLSTDLRTEMAHLRTEMRTEMADLRTDLRTEMADLRSEMHRNTTRMIIWFVGTTALFNSSLVALVTFVA